VTSRERVRTALDFQEPDRVPMDLGSNLQSGIMAHALDRLRREGWKPWRLWDGTEVRVPGQFQVEVDDEGGWLLYSEGDPSRPVEARMHAGGFYFDMPALTESRPDWAAPTPEAARAEHLLDARELQHMQARAEYLRATTDKALMLGAWDSTGLPLVGSIPDFLMLTATDAAYVKELFEARTEAALENLARLADHLGDSIDVIGMEGSDYAAQDRELIAPGLFEELCVPLFRRQNAWVHEHTGWKTWFHCCGSIPRLLPMLIDAGADTQSTLPFGSPEAVAAEVRQRIRIFAPGGGFVFNPIISSREHRQRTSWPRTTRHETPASIPSADTPGASTPASSPPRRSTRR